MKHLIFILITITIFSCKTSKIVTVVQDTTSVNMKIDTVLVLRQDTVRFDSLLESYFLLKEKIDSSNYREIVKTKILIKRELYKGASIDETFIVKDSIKIVNKDTLYYQPIIFNVNYVNGEIGLIFNPEINIPSSTEITIIKNKPITFWKWIRTSYTLYLLLATAILFLLVVLKLMS